MEDKENDIRLERDLHEGRTARDMKEARGEVRGKNWEGFFCTEKSRRSLSMELKMLFLWGICQNIIMFICGDSKMRRKGRTRWRGKKGGKEGQRR